MSSLIFQTKKTLVSVSFFKKLLCANDNGNTFWMIKIPISDRSLVVSFK